MTIIQQPINSVFARNPERKFTTFLLTARTVNNVVCNSDVTTVLYDVQVLVCHRFRFDF